MPSPGPSLSKFGPPRIKNGPQATTADVQKRTCETRRVRLPSTRPAILRQLVCRSSPSLKPFLNLRTENPPSIVQRLRRRVDYLGTLFNTHRFTSSFSKGLGYSKRVPPRLPSRIRIRVRRYPRCIRKQRFLNRAGRWPEMWGRHAHAATSSFQESKRGD